jgi:hypothetical protein
MGLNDDDPDRRIPPHIKSNRDLWGAWCDGHCAGFNRSQARNPGGHLAEAYSHGLDAGREERDRVMSNRLDGRWRTIASRQAMSGRLLASPLFEPAGGVLRPERQLCSSPSETQVKTLARRAPRRATAVAGEPQAGLDRDERAIRFLARAQGIGSFAGGGSGRRGAPGAKPPFLT